MLQLYFILKIARESILKVGGHANPKTRREESGEEKRVEEYTGREGEREHTHAGRGGGERARERERKRERETACAGARERAS